MKIGDVKNIKLAKKYSNALIGAALEAKNAEKICNDLIFINETIKTNSELSAFLYNPVVTLKDKSEAIEKLFTVHTDKMAVDFIILLIENGRLNVLNEVVNQYMYAYNRHRNVVIPQIISAVELNTTQKERIIDKLQRKLSKTVIPEYRVQPEIIGGVIVELEDKTFDCSLKTKFENMNKQLTKGNRYGND